MDPFDIAFSVAPLAIAAIAASLQGKWGATEEGLKGIGGSTVPYWRDPTRMYTEEQIERSKNLPGVFDWRAQLGFTTPGIDIWKIKDKLPKGAGKTSEVGTTPVEYHEPMVHAYPSPVVTVQGPYVVKPKKLTPAKPPKFKPVKDKVTPEQASVNNVLYYHNKKNFNYRFF